MILKKLLRGKKSNKDGRNKLYILSTLAIVVISSIVVTLLTNHPSQKGNKEVIFMIHDVIF